MKARPKPDRWDLGKLVWILDTDGYAVLQCQIVGRHPRGGYRATMPNGHREQVLHEDTYATHIEAEAALIEGRDAENATLARLARQG